MYLQCEKGEHMSVRDKILDAQLLYANGRKEGALLSVLIAVAATARKRYPLGTKKDGDAFISFLAEELPKVIGVGRFYVKFRSEMVLLQDLLYKYVRCNLAHEAILPKDIIFEQGDSLWVNVTDKSITFSDHLLKVLDIVVRNAHENKDDFQK